MLFRNLCSALFLLTACAGLAQTDGTRKWAFLTNGVVYSSPVIGTDGTIFVGTEGTVASQSRVYAIRPDGTVKWQFTSATDWIDSTPALSSDGTLYFGSWNGKLYAVNSSTGTRLWEFTALGFIASSPAIAADGTIYFGSGDRSVYAVNPNGSLKWSYPVADWVDSSPAISADGTIYFGSWDSDVYALRADGTLRWQFDTGNAVTSSPAIGADGTVYIGSTDGKMYALNGATGTKLWEYAAGTNIGSSPVLAGDGTVYFGSIDGYFYALNGSDGTLRWRYSVGAEILSSAAVRSDGTVIFGASDKHVYALNADGTLKWRLLTGDYVDSSPVIAADGTIYVGSTDKRLYAINGNGSTVSTASKWPMFRFAANRQGRAVSIASAAPTINSHITAQTVTTGGNVTLSVAASGTAPLTYQWQFGGVNITGATSASLTLSSVTSAQAGNYTVVVTNSAGSVTSSALVLTVSPLFVSQPSGISIDGSGNLYVSDQSMNTVQKITSAGIISLVAGTSGTAGSTDGAGTAARFNQPTGLSSTSTGILSVADTGNSTIRRITSDGTTSTFAGSTTLRGNTDGPGTSATFSNPMGMAQDSSGALYVADAMNHTIRKITSSGSVSTLAGSAGATGLTDGTGSAARFNFPTGIALDTSGTVYIADTTNNLIRKISTSGAVTTLAGLGGVSGSSDGEGSFALFNRPGGVATDTAGNLYLADTGNSLIRKITPTGEVSTLAGLPGIAGLQDGTGTNAFFNQPLALVVDASGNVYVADTGNSAIRKVTPAGVVTTVTLSQVVTPPPAPTPTPTPAPSPPSSGGSGGGGGAPSPWFLTCFVMLAIMRLLRNRSA